MVYLPVVEPFSLLFDGVQVVTVLSLQPSSQTVDGLNVSVVNSHILKIDSRR